MKLSADEEQMLAGEFGPGVQRSIELLIAVGEAYEAEKMIDISSSHILSPEMQFWNTGQLKTIGLGWAGGFLGSWLDSLCWQFRPEVAGVNLLAAAVGCTLFIVLLGIYPFVKILLGK